MFKVSLVQPNFPQGPKSKNAYYLPYSVGVLWAYAKQFSEVTDCWTLDELIFQREPINEVAERLAKSHLVGFSTYIWNRQYNYQVARKVKQLNPSCVIVFGGPEPEITNPDIFKKYPFMDLVVQSEGEKTFHQILLKFADKDFSSIPGLLINNNQEVINTGYPNRIDDLETIPSPYLSGIFDDLVKKHPTIEWNVILETNRGCPYQCTFCDWGSLTYNKIKKFDLTRVKNELEWFGANNCGFMSVADANFGIFPDRDNEIVDKLVEVQQKTGRPYRMNVAWAKMQKSEVVDIAKKLMGTAFNNGLTLSVQSLDETVLENIKRKNLGINKLEEVFELASKANVPVCTELILGLPGETPESWKNNFYKLFEINQHNGIEIFHCQILENAEMNLTQREKFQIKSISVDDYMSGSYASDEIPETVEVVVGTDTMGHDKMLESILFSWFINTFHIGGFSQLYSRFVRKHLDFSYEMFYNELHQYLNTLEWFQTETKDIYSLYDRWMKTGKIRSTVMGSVEIHGWNAFSKTILDIHANNKYDLIHESMENFFRTKFSDKISDDLLENLVELQQSYVVRYGQFEPQQKNLSYNLYDYLLGAELQQQPTTYVLDFPEDKTQDKSTFLQNIFYSRRRNFGKVRIQRYDS